MGGAADFVAVNAALAARVLLMVVAAAVVLPIRRWCACVACVVDWGGGWRWRRCCCGCWRRCVAGNDCSCGCW